MKDAGDVLIVRLDSAGDVPLAGPAVRAVAARAHPVALLAGPRGRAAAELLPGVDEVLCWPCPWVDPEPGPVLPGDVLAAADLVRRARVDSALILTSFHQDPLPTAPLLRLAAVSRITAACDDYPGTLLDVRHRPPERGLHEVERMLSVAAAAGFPAPRGRPGTVRAGPAEPWLRRGAPAGAAAVVTGNTGPAHLAAAVGTPVVSLFAPTVPAERWRPWGVPHVLLGAQDAPCAGSRAKSCPVPGHPCLAGVTAAEVTSPVRRLAAAPGGGGPRALAGAAAGKPDTVEESA